MRNCKSYLLSNQFRSKLADFRASFLCDGLKDIGWIYFWGYEGILRMNKRERLNFLPIIQTVDDSDLLLLENDVQEGRLYL